MEYKIKFNQLAIHKYGFTQAGTVSVDSETVRLSGLRLRGYLIILLFWPCVYALNNFVGMTYGVQLRLIPFLVICAVVLLILHYKWKVFSTTTASVEKRLITDVSRDRKNVSF